MIKIEVPGDKTINAKHLVLDYNGTMAIDGLVMKDVPELLVKLSTHLNIHVLTADTFGTVHKELKEMPVTIKILELAKQDKQKLNYVKNLGLPNIIAIGNGKNDLLMLKKSAFGIGVIQAEGACSLILNATHVICTNIIDALSLLINPKRLTATLRN